MSQVSKSTGGFLLANTSLVRAGSKSHTNLLDRPISQAHLDALNGIQATGWRVNTFNLDVAGEIWINDLGLAGVSETLPMPVPARCDKATWATMGTEEQRRHRAKQSAAHAHNRTSAGKLSALLETMSTATTLRDEEVFYYPHSLDFRGRIYPVASGTLSPQGNDFAKGLLMFSEGKPLGDDGEFWLCVRAANCAGQDKLSLVDRVAWIKAHADDVTQSAASPTTHRWWCHKDRDEPWGLLATCYELVQAWELYQSALFVSHLPVPLDGSCSGIQHLSAMGLDPVGARATNLCANLPRQDIYADVAALVKQAVKVDVSDGIVEAPYWVTRVDRSTVKRAVMTTPYGVSSRGIQQQLVVDGFCQDAEPAERTALSGYLRDKLQDALAATVVSAKDIMGWLQDTSSALADAQIAFEWTTPVGTRCRQAYYQDDTRQVRTIAGQVVLASPVTEGALLKSKAASASAPNVIHSYDAAHMALTVNAGLDAGIGSWAMIHDSFGTHACQTSRLAATLREEFIAMYAKDWLAVIRDDVVSYAPHVKLPDLPSRGTFDLTQVRDSEFFFA